MNTFWEGFLFGGFIAIMMCGGVIFLIMKNNRRKFAKFVADWKAEGKEKAEEFLKKV